MDSSILESFLDPMRALGTYSNSADQFQMQQNMASDQGLHYLLTGILKQILKETPKTTNGLIQMNKNCQHTGLLPYQCHAHHNQEL